MNLTMMIDDGSEKKFDNIQSFNISFGIPNNVSMSAHTTKDFTALEVTDFKLHLNVGIKNSTYGVTNMEATLSEEINEGIPGHVVLVIYFVVIIILDIWGLIIAKRAREEIDGETFGGGFL